MVSFVEHYSARVSKDGFRATRHFYCSRSFASRPVQCSGDENYGEKKQRCRRPSGKMETACTSKITTVQELPSAEIVAEICLNHYGHVLDRRHLQSLRLPMLEREKLSGKILSGVSLTRVLEDVIKTCEDLSEDALSDCEGNEDFGNFNPDKPLFTSKLTALHMLMMKDLRNMATR
ncbi:MAG: hypothetical protein GY696_01865, partial [Gammaproteobacteria bacterium]|nr:hypothetical protein [Gammaproteobacteria bacterium]